MFFTRLSLFCLCLLYSGNTVVCADRVYLDVTASNTRKIIISMPRFVDKSPSGKHQQLGKDLANTLGLAFEFHGIIDAIFRVQSDSAQATWKRQGADYIVLGQYTVSSSNNIKIELRLLDVAGNTIIMGKTFSGKVQQKNKMLFKFCDSVIKNLTGRPGIATSRIVFINRKKNIKEIFLTDILGKEFRQVTRHKNLVVSPRFVPGGTNLTYSSYHSGNQNLYITDLRQNQITRPLSRRKGLNFAPAWSSNGKYMILTLSKDGNPDLYLLDNKGKIKEQLTNRSGINVSAAISPDGKHLVFVSDRSGNPQLYYMDMRTRKPRRLTFEGSENAEPNWSPTESLIVYSSLRDGIYQLFTLNPFVNNSEQQVTHDLNHHESPNWSPDGKQIIFVKRYGKKSYIYGIMKEGAFQRRLFAFAGSQAYPQWSR